MTMDDVPVEVCIECRDALVARRSAMNARRGGAARIELCRDLETGGLTPGPVAMRAASDAFGWSEAGGALVMIRPRAGGFEYTADEVDLMERQIADAASAGAAGVVFGLLAADALAREHTRRLVDAAKERGLATTFHRAFDVIADSRRAVDELCEIGVDRILTSGTPWGSKGTALDGAANLASYIEHASGRIEIVIGGGVTRANVGEIIRRVIPDGRARVSVHAWSDVTVGGVVDAERVHVFTCSCVRVL